ncbi:neuropeptide Y receptor type 2-like [Tetranychus urticae]|uniref:G-protein coupled receptors family 1 profile domain-containing protein n=1 Tax=Tetranychus urticae TaxID=32264 RepID=T1L0J0_TETUR|nr:neuropeptide Y receptor type 2-like [Tetranychus urticae]
MEWVHNLSLESTNVSPEFNIFQEDFRSAIQEFITRSRLSDPFLQKFLTLVWIFFIASGLISNSILILVILTTPSLRSPNVLLLCNLFVADVTYTLFSMPFTLTTILNRSWPLGKFLCKTIPFVQTNTAFVTAGTVTAIAIDRQHRIIGHGNRLHRSSFHRSSYGCRVSIVIWLISFAFSSPLLYFQSLKTLVRLDDNLSLDVCQETSDYQRIRMVYHSMVYGFFIFVPTISLAISYLRIRSFLKYNGLEKKRQTHFLHHSGVNSNQVSNLVKKFDFLQKEINCNTKVTIILFMGIFIYVISWLPLCIYNLFLEFFSSSIRTSGSNITIITTIFHVIAISSATTNAFIYGYLNTNIQKELNSFFTKFNPFK